MSEAGKKGVRSRLKTNKGKKYNLENALMNKNHMGTTGLKWYHNPINPSEKRCFKINQNIPHGWERGQGKKAKNPGLNFHSKRLKSAGREIGSTGVIGKVEITG